MAGKRRVTAGVVIVAAALLGWIATWVTLPLLQHPDTTEDLTAAWTRAGPTPLGQTVTVAVPPGQTLVAFLVGTNLYGSAGTTGGSCRATAGGVPVDLGWPVYIDNQLTGVLADQQQTVAIAGWTNGSHHQVNVDIRCSTADSSVDHFVAVPTRTAVVSHPPWFAPWLWIAAGAVGLALIAAGVAWVSPPSR